MRYGFQCLVFVVFAALKARFFWEISWRVQVESTGITYA